MMLIPAISQWQEVYCSYKSRNWFPAGNAGKRSAMNVNRLSAISSLQLAPYEQEKATYFGLSR
jgi:hypothetical protein